MSCTPMLVVQDVAASSKWYQDLLALKSAHGGDQFEMLMGKQGLELMLHHVDFSEHPGIEDPREGTPGRGMLLYFSVSNVRSVFDRAREMQADLIDEPHFNPNARAIEFTLRDPDGYSISVSEWTGGEGEPDETAR